MRDESFYVRHLWNYCFINYKRAVSIIVCLWNLEN